MLVEDGSIERSVKYSDDDYLLLYGHRILIIRTRQKQGQWWNMTYDDEQLTYIIKLKLLS